MQRCETTATLELPEREEADYPIRAFVSVEPHPAHGVVALLDSDPEVLVDGMWVPLEELGMGADMIERACDALTEHALEDSDRAVCAIEESERRREELRS